MPLKALIVQSCEHDVFLISKLFSGPLKSRLPGVVPSRFRDIRKNASCVMDTMTILSEDGRKSYHIIVTFEIQHFCLCFLHIFKGKD